MDESSSGPSPIDETAEVAASAVIRDGKLYLNPSMQSYVATLIKSDGVPKDPSEPVTDAACCTLEIVKCSGPVVELTAEVRGVVPFDDKGLPNPTFVLALFPLLQTVKAGGIVSVLNPFSDTDHGSLPDRIRLTAWRVGWGRSDLEDLREACGPAHEILQEWSERSRLWGLDGMYQEMFLSDMKNRLSSLVDLLKGLGMGFDGGLLVGYNIWPKEPGATLKGNRINQSLVDLWRLCDDLVRWGYVNGMPPSGRPVQMDSLHAERMSHVLQAFDASLKTIESGSAELTPCESNIIETLRDTGHRLTTMKLLSAMTQRKMEDGESTVKKALARLVAEGRLTNRQETKPRGYGLPGWQE